MLKIMDIHSHSYYSNCGIDDPDLVIQTAIKGGINIFGISDHNHGIKDRIDEYRRHIGSLRIKYCDVIDLYIGFEVATVPGYEFHTPSRLVDFDYCLIEHIDNSESVVGMNIFEYSKQFPCRVGIAHTDLISMAGNHDIDPVEFLRTFAEHNIFWEMNVNYDSIHGYHEHEYWKRFMKDEQERELVRKSGILLSVGFDGHRVGDYKPERVVNMNKFLHEQGFKMVQLG